jgi:hypothetical protein
MPSADKRQEAANMGQLLLDGTFRVAAMLP